METENGIPITEVEQAQLQTCQQEVERLKASYLRLNADMENMKRRMHREQEMQINRVMGDLFSDLLMIIDNFDRALQASSSADPLRQSVSVARATADRSREYPTEDQLLQGLMLIRKEFAQILERYGVREMTEMTLFDPELHEALSQIPADGVTEPGTILTVLEKGYWYKDQVLRHAKVTVAA